MRTHAKVTKKRVEGGRAVGGGIRRNTGDEKEGSGSTGLRGETQSARELLYRSAGKSPCALSVATSSSARAIRIPRRRRPTSLVATSISRLRPLRPVM